jgi:hypothetical protein
MNCLLRMELRCPFRAGLDRRVFSILADALEISVPMKHHPQIRQIKTKNYFESVQAVNSFRTLSYIQEQIL